MVRFHITALAVGLICSNAAATPVPGTQGSAHLERRRENDWSCKSTKHPNPVVLLHGLGASQDLDLNFMEAWLRPQGFCTFAITYGSYTPYLPVLGGLKSIEQSSQEIASFIKEVHQRTGASKIDIVGHSEGGFQALYVPKFTGIAPIIDNIVAIAPPTRGTTGSGLLNLLYLFANASREAVGKVLNAVGCAACDDVIIGGKAVAKLNDGQPIQQPGNTITVLISVFDESVTPTAMTFIHEEGVHNIYVQDYCPLDPVGHIGEATDLNVWNLVLNSLEKKVGRKFICLAGPPGR